MIAKHQKKIVGNKKIIADVTELAIQAFDQVRSGSMECHE